MIITRNKASGWGPTLDYVLRRGDFLPPLRVIIFTPRVGSIGELASVRRAGVQHITEDEGSSSESICFSLFSSQYDMNVLYLLALISL
jgi:hypothetical protein